MQKTLFLLVIFSIIPFGVFAEDYKASPSILVTFHPFPLLLQDAYQGSISFDIGNGFTASIEPTYVDFCDGLLKSRCDLIKRYDSTLKIWMSYANLGIDWYLFGRSFEDAYLSIKGGYGIGELRMIDSILPLNIIGASVFLGYRVNIIDIFTASASYGYSVGALIGWGGPESLVGQEINFDIGILL